MRYRILYPSTLVSSFDLERVLPRQVYTLQADGDVQAEDTDRALEALFTAYNIGEPRPHPIRSMSVGDVVDLEERGAWICLSFGWSPVILQHSGKGFRVELLAGSVS